MDRSGSTTPSTNAGDVAMLFLHIDDKAALDLPF